MNDLLKLTACTVVERLRAGDLTPHDLLDALESRIAEVDGRVNALPTLCFERARAHADELMARDPADRGALAGLPVAIKDLADVAGVRTTLGSPLFADRVPASSDILVECLEASGGNIYAKSNTPEFGAGAHTFNEVFGTTLNPWDRSRSAAGSSGGSAVALATGMAWAAHGSDLGGSLRNPASFCGIVGLRPTPGRVAHTRTAKIDSLLSVEGPMARNVEDLALLLDAMAGAHPADPVSLPRDTSFLDTARSGWRPRRVAVSRDLGITPVEPEIADIAMAAARRFEDAGVIVEEAHPDLGEAHECFQVLRALSFAVSLGPVYEKHRDALKPEIVWNIEKGLALTAADIARAEHQRSAMFHRGLAFFETYDLLLTPATVVAPFPVGQRYVEECAGQRFGNYIEWLAIAYAVTLLAGPAISIPAGFTAGGLPVGLQMVAPPRADGRLLAGARALEDILGLKDTVPMDPR
ncbi:MAG: amidase [Hyphomicrobiales bacterium]